MCTDEAAFQQESEDYSPKDKSMQEENVASSSASAGTSSSASASTGHSSTVLGLIAFIAMIGIAGVIELGVLLSSVSIANQPTTIINLGDGSIGESSAIIKEGGSELVPDEVGSNNRGENTCAGANPNFPNVDCIIDGMTKVGPQSGANVTKGFKGEMEVDFKPITTPYWQNGLCPVNVHWHLGAEHYSVGQFDEDGKGVREIDVATDGGVDSDMGAFQCHHYDKDNAIFTKPYEWKHCIGMEVGQTYEVHWPHSKVGACGTPNQYQSPFYDGVFCNLDLETFQTLNPQDIAYSVGVQAQVFTIVNDESYFWPNLMRGMIVDGDYGKDLAIYTGSTTGSARSNTVCSQYSPITWQVDRNCHLISASSFDMMCAEMKMQRDDMTYDLVAHGARVLVSPELTANNQGNRNLRSKE